MTGLDSWPGLLLLVLAFLLAARAAYLDRSPRMPSRGRRFPYLEQVWWAERITARERLKAYGKPRRRKK